MKVCKITCDICESEMKSQGNRIGLGKVRESGQFSEWWTFDLCEECFKAGKPTLKSAWHKFMQTKDSK